MVIQAFYIFCSLILYTLSAVATPIQVEVHGVKVIETKPNGAHWDTGFGTMILPDLQVRIYQGKNVLWSTAKVSNRYESARVFTSPILILNDQSSLIIEVIDKDLRADDLIERFKVNLNEVIGHTPRKFQLSGKSVISLKLLLRSAQSP